MIHQHSASLPICCCFSNWDISPAHGHLSQSPAHGTLKVCCPWADFCHGAQMKIKSPCICCRLACSIHFFSAVVHLFGAGEDADQWKRSISLKYSPITFNNSSWLPTEKMLQPTACLEASTPSQAKIRAVVRQCRCHVNCCLPFHQLKGCLFPDKPVFISAGVPTPSNCSWKMV